MSFNDRCGEALEILAHGGLVPNTQPLRDALIDWLQDGKDGIGGPPRALVYEIRDHPANADLKAQTADGEWIGGEDQ